MADSLPNIPLQANTWVDLYAATSIVVGTQIVVQNLGTTAVFLTTLATEPPDLSAYSEIHPDTNIGMQNETGDSGAWAYSANVDGLLSVEASA